MVLRERRDAALALMAGARKYLEWQVRGVCVHGGGGGGGPSRGEGSSPCEPPLLSMHKQKTDTKPNPDADAAPPTLPCQAEDWHAFSGCLGEWLHSVVALHEGFKARTAASEGDVRTTLKAKREAYSAEDAEREGALEAAVAAVGQVCGGEGGGQLKFASHFVTGARVVLRVVPGAFTVLHLP